jgi:palmitoyl-protein thioesterase
MLRVGFCSIAVTFGIAIQQDPEGPYFPAGLPDDCCPNLKNFTNLAREDPEAALQEILNSPLHSLVNPITIPEAAPMLPDNGAHPIVLTHGVTDSCFSDFMVNVTAAAGARAKTHAVCIAQGKDYLHDYLNSLLVSMDDSIDNFAAQVRADPKLKHGFNGIGISQGAILMRGYIEKYNDPPVKSFLSIHGIPVGVAGLPKCFQQGKPLGLVCKAVDEVLSDLAYNPTIQGFAFPADEFRDPFKTKTQYFLDSQLAELNNENPLRVNHTYKENFAKVERFAMVKAWQDTTVYPNEGSWFGQYADNSYKVIETMNETELYKNDTYGLRTVDEQGRVCFETTPGDHMAFSDDTLNTWIDRHFLNRSACVAPDPAPVPTPKHCRACTTIVGLMEVGAPTVHLVSDLLKFYCWIKPIGVASEVVCDVLATSVATIAYFMQQGYKPEDICEHLNMCAPESASFIA